MARYEDFNVTLLRIGGTEVTATAAEINAAADNSANADKMSASTVMAATLADYQAMTQRSGNIIKTTIVVDLTGATSVTTNNDIIGAAGACHIGQVTTAVNGLIYKGQVSCLETPATGDDDIDLSCASVATGAYDADVTGLTNYAALCTAGGGYTAGIAPKDFSAAPTADYYLYLSTGDTTAGTYTAGILVIEMWGLAS